MTVINPGTLNKVAQVIRLNQSKKDDLGFKTKESWEVVKTIRCAVITEENKSIRTAYKSGVIANLDVKILTCRYFDDLRHSDRIILNKKQYEIEIVNNVEEANKEYRIWIKGTNT